MLSLRLCSGHHLSDPRGDWQRPHTSLKWASHSMTRSRKPLEIIVYQDVLCAWCYVAQNRLETVRREFGNALRWSTRPYALRIKEALPSQKELHDWLSEVERARREPEGQRLSNELWRSSDPPHSSLPALAALEAAALQGHDARDALARSMQRAALELGLNVARPDIALELACSVGLDMNRFVPAWRSQQTRKLILKEHRSATRRGVKGVPTLVLGGRWMLSGLRELTEYREQILTCLDKHERDESPAGGTTIIH